MSGEKTIVAFVGKLPLTETFWHIFNQNIKQELCNKHFSQHNRPTAVVVLQKAFLILVCLEAATMDLVKLIVK